MSGARQQQSVLLSHHAATVTHGSHTFRHTFTPPSDLSCFRQISIKASSWFMLSHGREGRAITLKEYISEYRWRFWVPPSMCERRRPALIVTAFFFIIFFVLFFIVHLSCRLAICIPLEFMNICALLRFHIRRLQRQWQSFQWKFY